MGVQPVATSALRWRERSRLKAETRAESICTGVSCHKRPVVATSFPYPQIPQFSWTSEATIMSNGHAPETIRGRDLLLSRNSSFRQEINNRTTIDHTMVLALYRLDVVIRRLGEFLKTETGEPLLVNDHDWQT